MLRALQADPGRRFQSVGQFADAVERARGGMPRWGVAAGVAGVVAAAALLWSAFGRGGPAESQTGRSAALEGGGVLLDDRFDDGAISTNGGAGWTVLEAGKSLVLEPGSGGGLRWASGGSSWGFASLRCNDRFAVPATGWLEFTWEISGLGARRSEDASYTAQFSVVPAAIDAEDPDQFAHLFEIGGPTIALRLRLLAGREGVNLECVYKNGSSAGVNAAREHGQAIDNVNLHLKDWDRSDGGRHQLWLRIGRVGFEAGWSGGPERLRTTWEEAGFDPPSPDAFGAAVWPLLFGQNSEGELSGTHVVHRLTVRATGTGD